MKIYHVDAFTGQAFGGNPAVVVPVDAWPEEALMRRMAAEHNQSETAFVGPPNYADTPHADRRIRWFTPAVEVPRCGRSTGSTSMCGVASLWIMDFLPMPPRVSSTASRVFVSPRASPMPASSAARLTKVTALSVSDLPKAPNIGR